MKFPRNEKILRSPFEVAPFAAVLFLVVIFLLVAALLPTPGIPLQLPAAANLPGADKPSISVAMDPAGRFYFANQILGERELEHKLATARKKSGASLTLVIQADKSVTLEQLAHLTLIARDAGIQNSVLATLPLPENSRQP